MQQTCILMRRALSAPVRLRFAPERLALRELLLGLLSSRRLRDLHDRRLSNDALVSDLIRGHR